MGFPHYGNRFPLYVNQFFILFVKKMSSNLENYFRELISFTYIFLFKDYIYKKKNRQKTKGKKGKEKKTKEKKTKEKKKRKKENEKGKGKKIISPFIVNIRY